MERLKRPESRRMAQPLASVGAFEGFEGFEGFEAFEGQFRATRKKRIWRARAPSPQPAQLRPQSRRAQSPQSGKCEVLERLILAEPRDV